MNRALKLSLILSLSLSTILAHSQVENAAPPAGAAPIPISTAVIDNDSRSSVRAFKTQLKALYADGQDASKSGNLAQDIAQLRLAATAPTATVMLNSGLGLLANQAAFSAVVSGIAQTRPDKQFSAQSASAGTTSLVSTAGGASILAMALDAGALTNSVSGTTSTVSGNLEGIGSLLLNKPAISIDPNNQNWLRKISGDVNLLATFALSQPSTQTTSTTAPATGTSPPAGTPITIPSSVGKLTGITAQFAIHNPFDPHSAVMRRNWEATKPNMVRAAPTLFQGTAPLVAALDCAACQQDWVIAKAALKTAATDQSLSPEQKQQAIADAFDSYVNSSIAHAQQADPDLNTKIVNAVKVTAAYQTLIKKAVDDTVGNLFTVEYDYAKPPNQPETHDFKLIYGYATTSTTAINTLLKDGSGAKSMFTANADISVYGGALPASATYGRLHYGQISAEFDTPIVGSAAKNAVFTLAGYWQYQPSPSVLTITQSDVAPGTSIPSPTQVLVGTSGSLWVTQAKITISNGKSGINVPIGVKWSNKTDLLSGNKIGGQIGISYDFSSLSSLFGGGN